MPLQPFQKLTMQKLAGAPAQTPEARRTLPVNVNGRKFSIQLYDSANVQTDIVLQVNNANYTDPGKPFHTIHPIGSFYDNTVAQQRDALIGSGFEVASKSDSFDDTWTNLHTFTGGATTELYAESNPYRFIRLLYTNVDPQLDMSDTLIAYVCMSEK